MNKTAVDKSSFQELAKKESQEISQRGKKGVEDLQTKSIYKFNEKFLFQIYGKRKGGLQIYHTSWLILQVNLAACQRATLQTSKSMSAIYLANTNPSN